VASAQRFNSFHQPRGPPQRQVDDGKSIAKSQVTGQFGPGDNMNNQNQFDIETQGTGFFGHNGEPDMQRN
jgi:hypothetical protein